MTARDARQVRAVIDEVLRTGTAVGPTGTRPEVFPVAVPAAEGEALRDLVIAEGATDTIEIGLGYGISALHICEGLLTSGRSEGRHTVIDPYQRTRFDGIGLDLLERAGVADMVRHRPLPSEIVLPMLLDEDARFDLAFIDGNHRFDGVFVDLFFLGRLLRPGSVVFLDDHQLPGIRKATSFFVANLGWSMESVSEPDELHRWAVLRTATADDRPYDYFADF